MNNGRLIRQTPGNPILDDAEVARRVLLLIKLQTNLEALGVRCVLARNHRLVLRYNDSPLAPSGLTDPMLHIFAPDAKQVATTDGACYRLSAGQEFPVGDPAVTAAAIRSTAQAARS
jgi:hypothetical protein